MYASIYFSAISCCSLNTRSRILTIQKTHKHIFYIINPIIICALTQYKNIKNCYIIDKNMKKECFYCEIIHFNEIFSFLNTYVGIFRIITKLLMS